MDPRLKSICLLLDDERLEGLELEIIYAPVERLETLTRAIEICQKKPVSCLVVSIYTLNGTSEKNISLFSHYFPRVPILALVPANDQRLIKDCIFSGAWQVLSVTEWIKINERISFFMDNRHHPGGEGEITCPSLKEAKAWLQRAVSLIEHHFDLFVGVMELADALGVSSAVLSREFNRRFGIYLLRYLYFKKIAKALSLLKNPTMVLTEMSKLT